MAIRNAQELLEPSSINEFISHYLEKDIMVLQHNSKVSERSRIYMVQSRRRNPSSLWRYNSFAN